jgi:transcriptional regulator with GAF, ATPase, and Fis domain
MERFWSVADVAHDGPSDDVRRMLEGIDARACVNVPLHASGESVGHILVLRRKPLSFSERSTQLFEVLGEQAAAALMRAWQLEEAQRRARREELTSKATARMHESLDLEGVLNAAVRDIGEALGLAALDVRLGPVPVPYDSGDPARGNGGGLHSQNRRGEEV